MTPISLSMLKMEKNFIAHLDKEYSRKPYDFYPIVDTENPRQCLIGFVTREQEELDQAIERLLDRTENFNKVVVGIQSKQELRDHIIQAMWEVADVSNTLDYLFEGLIQYLGHWEGEEI